MRILLALLLATACTRGRDDPGPPPTSPAPIPTPSPSPPPPDPTPPPPAAPPLPGPRWTSGPDRTYRCTRYVADPEPKPGARLALTLPPDKPMKFKLAARPTSKQTGPVRFEAAALPAGATLTPAGQFTWKTAGTAGQQIAFTLTAVGTDGGRSDWPLAITIADDKLRTAWRAGMGSVSPDCDVVFSRSYEVADFDGDGHDDAMYHVIEDEEETAITTHVKLWRKGGFSDALELMNRTPEFVTASDGSRLAIAWENCCFILELDVYRLDGDTFDAVGTRWQVPHGDDPDEHTELTLLRDKQGRISGVEQKNRAGVERWRWRDGDFEPL